MKTRSLIAVCSVLVGGCGASVEPTMTSNPTPVVSDAGPEAAPVSVPDASPDVDAGPVATLPPDAAPDAPTVVPDAGSPILDASPPVDAAPALKPGDFLFDGVVLSYACKWTQTFVNDCNAASMTSTWSVSSACASSDRPIAWIIIDYTGSDPQLRDSPAVLPASLGSVANVGPDRLFTNSLSNCVTVDSATVLCCSAS